MTMKTAMKAIMLALAVIATVVCRGQELTTIHRDPTNLVATGRRDAGDISLRSYPTPKTARELRGLFCKVFASLRKRDLDALKTAVDNTLECADYSKFKEKYGENADFKKADPAAIKFAEDLKNPNQLHGPFCGLELMVKNAEHRRKAEAHRKNRLPKKTNPRNRK